MVDHSAMRLGLLPDTKPHGLLELKNYSMPSAVPLVDWTRGTEDGSWGMAGNDLVADCALAAVAHILHGLERWREGAGRIVETNEVLENYKLFGYDPPKVDPGVNLLDMLKVWMDKGLKWQGEVDKLDGAAFVEFDQMQQALGTFGLMPLALDMPKAAARQMVFTNPVEITSDDNVPGGWGGHCAVLGAWGTDHVKLITWGQIKLAEIGWLKTYCVGAWALLHRLWEDGPVPTGELQSTLRADMAKLQNA